MPEQWMRDLMGEEERPRRGFEDELAARLQRSWHDDTAPSPWRKILLAAAAVALVIAGVAVLTGRDKEANVPAGTTAVTTPVTTPATGTGVGATTSAGPAGSPYVAFGSSVMLGAKSELEAAGVVVDAVENRGNQGFIDALTEATESGVIGSSSTVLLQIGQNGTLTAADAAAIVAAVPVTVTRIVVMTVTGPVAWIPAANDVIRALPDVDGRVRVLDWAAQASDVPLCSDGIHISCSTTAVWRYSLAVLDAFGLGDVAPTTVDPALPDGPARPVKEYAVALADGDWMHAAKLLGEGGEEWTTRADLRPLYRSEFGLRREDGSQEGLAAALARWCTRAACGDGITSINDLGDNWFSVAVAGQGNFSLYRVITFEGQAGVRGLPLQTRADTPIAATDNAGPLCPTDAPVAATAWADLDGDGWMELLVAQRLPIAGATDVFNFLLSTCGTSVDTTLMLEAIPDVFIGSVNATGAGGDYLLAGRRTPELVGSVFAYANGALFDPRQSPGNPVTFRFAASTSLQSGNAMGCEVVDGAPVIVTYTFQIDGDTLHYDYRPILGGAVDGAAVPMESEEAVRVLSGVCNGLPVITT